jgi:16S rRNA (guanine966-N2)-methyltransferase
MSRGRSDRESPSGRLRIVAGKWRSRLLPIADEPGLRPTSERIRETLFNWLAPTVEGSRCLDLFAGSGALGLEALSRGAREVVFVEKSVHAVEVLEASVSALDAEGARVHAADALSFLRGDGQAFDIVFLDLDERGWLTANAMVYLEQDRDRPLPDLPDGWVVLKEKTAGQVRYALVTVKD